MPIEPTNACDKFPISSLRTCADGNICCFTSHLLLYQTIIACLHSYSYSTNVGELSIGEAGHRSDPKFAGHRRSREPLQLLLSRNMGFDKNSLGNAHGYVNLRGSWRPDVNSQSERHVSQGRVLIRIRYQIVGRLFSSVKQHDAGQGIPDVSFWNGNGLLL